MKLGHEIHYDEGESPAVRMVVELPREVFDRSMTAFEAISTVQERLAFGRALTPLMHDWDKENNPKGVFGNPFAPWVSRWFPPVGGS